MIPKIIHYCWFGKGEKPELAKKCIESWKKFCPDYQLVEWNEDNFNIDSAPKYVKEAYEAKKFAFVTDYVRLYAMTTCGGIYMDTDVEVLKPLDPYLQYEAFSGFENGVQIPTGIMACEAEFPLFSEFLEEYDSISFIKENGCYDYTTNVTRITNICNKYGFQPNGKIQSVNGFMIYPQNVFCPEHSKIEDKNYMKDTVTIHWFAGSWKSESQKKREKTFWWLVVSKIAPPVSKSFKKIFGEKWDRMKDKFFIFMDKER